MAIQKFSEAQVNRIAIQEYQEKKISFVFRN